MLTVVSGVEVTEIAVGLFPEVLIINAVLTRLVFFVTWLGTMFLFVFSWSGFLKGLGIEIVDLNVLHCNYDGAINFVSNSLVHSIINLILCRFL